VNPSDVLGVLGSHPANDVTRLTRAFDVDLKSDDVDSHGL